MKYIYIIIVLLFLSSCKKNKASSPSPTVASTTPAGQAYCDTVTVSFSSQVKPIFNVNCSTSGCHNSASSAGGYVLMNYSQISNNNTITRSLNTMKHMSGYSPMPKFAATLNDSLIQQIECWINQGKQNN